MEFIAGAAAFILINGLALIAARTVGTRLAGPRIADALLGAFVIFFAQVTAFGAILGFTGRIGPWWYVGAAIVLSGALHLLTYVRGASGPLLKPAFEAFPRRPLPTGFFLSCFVSPPPEFLYGT